MVNGNLNLYQSGDKVFLEKYVNGAYYRIAVLQINWQITRENVEYQCALSEEDKLNLLNREKKCNNEQENTSN